MDGTEARIGSALSAILTSAVCLSFQGEMEKGEDGGCRGGRRQSKRMTGVAERLGLKVGYVWGLELDSLSGFVLGFCPEKFVLFEGGCEFACVF